MVKKSLIIGVALTFLLSVCLLRVSYLASEGRLFSEASDDQSTRRLTVSTVRGTIYDRKGVPLTNAGSEIRAAIAPTAAAMRTLRESLPSSESAPLLERLREGGPILARFAEWLPPTDGIVQFQTPLRYGTDALAPHVIGYVNGGGVSGVEYAFDDWLTACSGEQSASFRVNGLGQPIADVQPERFSSLDNALAGVTLTLEVGLQQLAESAATMTRGAVVIADAKTGEIRALVSRPDFDQNNVAAALSAEGSPLLNRAITDYNVGSVFKIVTTAAALEAGIPVSQTFACNGAVQVGDTAIHCHNRLGHGVQTMEEAFANSCNPYYVQLAQQVGAARLYAMAVSLGLARALPLCDNWQTARAVLPSLATLLSSPSELANLAFGQGQLLVTPVHLSALVGAVVNDGVWQTPSLLVGLTDRFGKTTPADRPTAVRAFSASTAATLRRMMELVLTDDGTSANAAPLWGTAAGKSGTAETGWYEDGSQVVQSWMAGYCPADDPRYTVIVLVENSIVSGERSAPIFRTLCEELYFYDLQQEKR
ncbi:MAG: penicillin-binding protein 2 [Clostridia bacterium]|nr:penicillin-binding protein 2 [Clostridia bacterium]